MIAWQKHYNEISGRLILINCIKVCVLDGILRMQIYPDWA